LVAASGRRTRTSPEEGICSIFIPQGTNMATTFILEDVAVVENDFSADSRDKDGMRVVTFDTRRSIKLHLAIEQIVQIEVVKDAKLDEGRSIVTLTSGHRYITRRSAQDICAAIAKVSAAP
jgi:hypothetical protein